MADSPAHKFGQLIGDFLQDLVQPRLESFCITHSLFLDYQRKKRSIRNGKKVTWSDRFGNCHDLDFVIEKGGSDTKLGEPIAFIEVAWRRYTKHSRNKAQEIQGAILPLHERYKWNNPFLGSVLGGEFTSGSLEQLKSNGFQVLYIRYESLVKAFQDEGIDICFDEATPDKVFHEAAVKIQNIELSKLESIKKDILTKNQVEVDRFYQKLEKRFTRYLTKITIIPLYGVKNEFHTISDAIIYLNSHSIYEKSGEFIRYEIIVEFSNDDKVQASLSTKDSVLEFLGFVSAQ